MDDPAEAVARIADDRRERMLRIHRRRLRWEDLEDCYSQATLELVTRSRRSPFESIDHVQNALEQKFLSRIEDKRRAIGGRSSIEAAIARAVPVDASEPGSGDLEDRRAAVEQQVLARIELSRVREVIADLTRDQQLVLASQVCVDMGVGEFCASYGWSVEKYRKVAQRARGKLRALVEEYERGDRCQRLELDILALSAGVAEGQELARAKAHLANCRSCAQMAGELDRAARSVAAVLPLPAALFAGALSPSLGGLLSAARRVAAILRHPLTETGYSGVGAAGGSMASLGAVKMGIAMLCVAGAAGSYAACSSLGVLPPLGFAPHPRQAVQTAPARGLPKTSHRSSSRLAVVTEPPNVGTPRAGRAPTTARTSTSRVHAVRHRIGALEQTRREFGVHRAHPASASSPAATTSGSVSAVPVNSTPAPSPASPGQARQAQAEFGFER